MHTKYFFCKELHVRFFQGVPRETPEEDTLKTCLEEINRCREDNGMPYFLNMTRLVRL